MRVGRETTWLAIVIVPRALAQLAGKRLVSFVTQRRLLAVAWEPRSPPRMLLGYSGIHHPEMGISMFEVPSCAMKVQRKTRSEDHAFVPEKVQPTAYLPVP